MFQLTLDSPGFDPDRVRSLQLVFWGGAHAAPELVERLRQLPPRLAPSYVQTESVGSVTFAPRGPGRNRTLPTVGCPLKPYQVQPLDDRGRRRVPRGRPRFPPRSP